MFLLKSKGLINNIHATNCLNVMWALVIFLTLLIAFRIIVDYYRPPRQFLPEEDETFLLVRLSVFHPLKRVKHS